MKSQKGFTLIELLAVIVVLAILMLVAGTSVFGALDNAEKNQFRNEFLGLIDAARLKANLDMMNNQLTIKKPCECITITELVNGGHFENPRKYEGSVALQLDGQRTLTITGWMASDTFMISGKTSQVTGDEVESYNPDFSSKYTNCENKCGS